MNVHVLSDDKVSSFAGSELKHYLFRMGCPQLNYQLRVDGSLTSRMECADNELDDWFCFDVNAQKQVIIGNNPRALLLGVYQYLTRIGCRFLRPGKSFEIVPVYHDKAYFYAYEKRGAFLRHRGVCIEGCDSIDNIADFLDWLPKIGCNSFFFQFKHPHTFLKRWYLGYNGSHEKQAEWTQDNSIQIMQYFNEMMEERGFLRHRMGHGWTAEVIGASNAIGWNKEEIEISENVRPFIAEIDGKRELHGGVAVNTNLCLSNPQALERFAECVMDYIRKNPDTEYLHVWLADGTNNSCECFDCRTLRPSDRYISLLNYLDKKLTECDSKIKLCFLMYEDLLWAPIQNRLDNPERFVLMFAPINRTFESSYEDCHELPDIPTFALNALRFPEDMPTNLAFLKAWQDVITCDSFVYDYHVARAHHGDPAHVGISRILCRDLKANRNLGLNGILSCQELRVGFPNSLANYVMGHVALRQNVSFEEIAKDYYQSAYGDSGEELFVLMEQVSKLFRTDYVNYQYCKTPRLNAELCLRMKKVPAVLEKIRELLAHHKPVQYEVQTHMWNALQFFADSTELMAEMIMLRAEGQKEQALALFENEYKPLMYSREKVDQSAMDVARHLNTIYKALKAE